MTRFATQWLPIGLIIATITYYFGFLYQHAINVPFADDIFDVLQVLSDLIRTEDQEATFYILYEQHNDHRTLASRLFYYSTYLATGEIDFRTLTFLANLALPLLLGLLYLAARQHPQSCLVLLAATLIMFQLRGYGIILWSMAAFAYFYVFLYGFSSLYCLHKVNWAKFTLAVFLATLATFTLASGQMIWLVGFISLLHQSAIRRSVSHLYAACWITIAIAVVLAWRWGLETPNTLPTLLANFFSSPGHHVLYTLTLLGNAVSESSVALAALAGAAMMLTVLISTVKSYSKEDVRLELCCWFVVLSVMAMVLGRSFTTVDYALSSRYSFPSVLMLATTWVLVVVRLDIKSRAVLVCAALLAGAYCISSYKIYAVALQPHIEKRVTKFNQSKYWAWPHPMRETNDIVAEAVSLGIYTPPPRPLPNQGISNIENKPVRKEKE